MWPRILRALLVAYLAATAVHIGFVMAHEPFAFDAWNTAFDTRGEPFSIGRLFEYWRDQYAHSNPRVGQAFSYLSYKLEYFAVVATPLAYLALALATVVLGLGRAPRAGRELALVAVAVGFGWFVFPEIGRNMFSRAYGANYVYGAAIQLWFLVPLRIARSRDRAIVPCVAYAVAGLIAGACNEHTGPALSAVLVGYGLWLRRRGERARLVWAGALGFVAGFAAIFFAPGQSERYDGLAGKTGLAMRFAQRGVVGVLDIFGDYLRYAAPLLAVIAIAFAVALVRPATPERANPLRPAVRLVGLALAIGLAMTATLVVSPKLGARFYLVAMALLAAATFAVVDAAFARPRPIAVLVAIAAFASGYAAVRTIPLYARVSEQSDARMAGLAETRTGDVFVADAFDQLEESWWFIGDDFRDPRKREHVANYLGLARVSFRGFALGSPLGSLGIRLVPKYWVTGERCARDDADLDLEGRGLDVAGIVDSTRASVEVLWRRQRFERFELAVEFIGAAPAVPRSRLLIARSNGDRLESYVGTIVRPGPTTERELKLGPGFDRALELYIYQVGGEFRRLGTANGEPLRYTPWRTGVYWALACDASACWVVAAARNHAI